MYENEDWFVNMLVQENVNIAITKHEHIIHGGFRPRRSPNLPKDWQLGHDRIYDDYFFGNLVYDGNYLKGNTR